MSKFTYGELLAIYDGLEELPDDSIISYKSGINKFDPVVVSELKLKVMAEVELFDSVNDLMNRV